MHDRYLHRLSGVSKFYEDWIYKRNLLKAADTERDATRRQEEANIVIGVTTAIANTAASNR
jgi:hypothetical protein